jgi:hypothetical protein
MPPSASVVSPADAARTLLLEVNVAFALRRAPSARGAPEPVRGENDSRRARTRPDSAKK